MSRAKSKRRAKANTRLAESMAKGGVDGLIWYQHYFFDEWDILPIHAVPESKRYWLDVEGCLSQRESEEGVFGFIRAGEISFDAGEIRPIEDTRERDEEGRLLKGDETDLCIDPDVICEISEDELKLAVANAGAFEGKRTLSLSEMKSQLLKLAVGDPAGKAGKTKPEPDPNE